MDYKISSPWHSKQVVILGEKVVTALKSNDGVVIQQWKLSEIIDIAFFPAARVVAGKKVDKPFGQIRLARTWEDRRRGPYLNDEHHPLGIWFGMRDEDRALELFNDLKEHPEVKLQTPTHKAQVETESFVLTLTGTHLIITHRPYASGFRQAFAMAWNQPEIDAETILPLQAIQGVKLREARHDKLEFGTLSGILRIYTTVQGAKSSFLGQSRNELELNFTRRSEGKVREFVAELEKSLGELTEKRPQEKSNAQSRSVADELAKLAALHESGALTKQEFEQAKRRLLTE